MDEQRDNVKRLKENPLDRANVISRIFFCWLLPFFIKGYKRVLTEDDIYQHRRSHDAGLLGNKLEETWNEERRTKKNPSLLKAIVKVFYKECCLFYILAVLLETDRLIQPFVLSKILQLYEQSNVARNRQEIYIYSIILIVLNLFIVFLYYAFSCNILQVGIKIRIACTSLIYRKSLKLSKTALAETTVGHMVNLISNDVVRFESTLFLHQLVIGPIQAVLGMGMLYHSVGWTGLSGAVFLFIFIPIQSYLAKKTSQFRLKTATLTDERVHIMNEIISGIQVIKMYTWEIPFSLLVKSIRLTEMKYIRLNSIIKAILVSCTLVLHRTAVFFCIVVYVLTGNTLTASYAFTTTSYYKLMNNVTRYLPMGVTEFAEILISVRRVQEFLMLDEVHPEDFHVEHAHKKQHITFNHQQKIKSSNTVIHLKNVYAKWIKSQGDCTLKDVTLKIQATELCAIVGPVGSGKSTLLHVILQELRPIDGSVKISGTISFAPQEPWIFGATIRQNILFGEPYDEEKYREVVKVCALERDFQLLSHGDGTLVGERGLTLSGGQRARINLARAVYKEADIYLLDDPLSAVDARVGTHLFEECICGYLKNKCIILVTHQMKCLQSVKNKIILVRDGKIEIAGSNQNWKELSTDFEEEKMQSKHKVDEFEENYRKNDTIQELSKEEKVEGDIAIRIYKSYIKAGGHWCKVVLLVIFFVFSQALDSTSEYFVTFWVNFEQLNEQQNLIIKINTSDRQSIPLEVRRKWWYSIFSSEYTVLYYSCLFLLIVLFTITRSLAFYKWCLTAATRMHHRMFNHVIYSPMNFFHINPSGRILNRFSRDFGILDEILPITILDTMQIGLSVLSIIFIIASLNSRIVLPTLIMLIVFYVMRKIYLETSRDIKRIDSITSSPIYTHLTASVQGLTTIRAFKAQEILKKEFNNLQNSNSAASFITLGAHRTFAFWLDFVCALYISLVIIFLVLIENESFGGNIGLTLTQSTAMIGLFQWGVRQWSELINQMTSVERIQQYADLVPEQNDNTKEPTKSWPEKGQIEFNNVSMRYSKDGSTVLKQLSFVIKSEEKIGIVGRTGAGKTSLIQALFALSDTKGEIYIDGVKIKSVPLDNLRSKIAIIPQEPMLFSGSLRKNLDPFEEYKDEVLWNALEDVNLKSAVDDLPAGLENKMAERGSNFSVGQRQLLCLARAILRKNKILVLDEATANVDPHTDELIQETIRNKFRDCTVLTIAHRLHTVMDSDKVLVMDAGRVIEFDHPHILLQNNSGVFYSLVEQTGKSTARSLKNIAEQSYNKKRQGPNDS